MAEPGLWEGLWLRTSPRRHQRKSWLCEQRRGHGCWVTKNSTQVPHTKSCLFSLQSIFQIYFKSVPQNHSCLSDSPASALSQGFLSCYSTGPPSFLGLFPFPSTQLPDSLPETHTDFVTLLFANLPRLPTTCGRRECPHGTSSLLLVARPHFWPQPQVTLGLHALVHAELSHLENHLFRTLPSSLLLILFQGPSQTWLSRPLRLPGASSSRDFRISFHPGDPNAVGTEILESGDCGCPAPSLTQGLDGSCSPCSRPACPSAGLLVLPASGGWENPSWLHFLFSTSAQLFLVPGSSSPESSLSEDGPGHSSAPGEAVLPISCLSLSGFESEGLSLEPSSEPLLQPGDLGHCFDLCETSVSSSTK